MSTADEIEDILKDSLEFLGGEPVVDSNIVQYGDLTLSTARKEGKANTLLADHLFSPGLFLAERIERRELGLGGQTVLELGAGTGLPSFLAATISPTPALVVVTDYPDENILGNLQGNAEKNRSLFAPGCTVQCAGYDWGKDSKDLVGFLPPGQTGFDTLILSDLLHFDSCHDVLVASIVLLLQKAQHSRVHVSAGNYTRPSVCDQFLRLSSAAGLVFEEKLPNKEERSWLGKMEVSGLSKEDLALRKSVCRYWIGRWSQERLAV